MAPRLLSSLSSVLCSIFITINSGLWLTYEIINYVPQSIIQPDIPRMHCYIVYFFQLLLGSETSPTYNYAAVNNWSSNIDVVASIFDLRELYIPINKGDVHWILLRV